MIITNIGLGFAFLAIAASMHAKAKKEEGDTAKHSRLSATLFAVAGGLFFVAAAIRAVTD
jgi:hypothetical protein